MAFLQRVVFFLLTSLLIFTVLPAAARSPRNSYAPLLHKPYAERCLLLDSLFYAWVPPAQTRSFLKDVRALGELAKEEGDRELFLEMRLAEYHITGWNQTASNVEELERHFLALIKKADAEGILSIRIRARHYLARHYYHHFENYDAAIGQYLNAYYLLKPLSVRDFPDKRFFVYNDLAGIYYWLGDYDAARKYLLEVTRVSAPSAISQTQIRDIIDAYNTLGLTYRNTGGYDSAEYYFIKARGLAREKGNAVWVSITGGNIGTTYFLQGRYAEALPLLEEDVRASTAAAEYRNAAPSCLRIAAIHLAGGRIAEARQALAQARDLLTRLASPDQRIWGIHMLEGWYGGMAQLEAAEGNFSAAYRYADSALIAKDTAAAKKSALFIARAQQRTERAHHAVELERAEHQRALRTIQRNSLLLLLVLSGIITVLLINRQRLLRQEKENAEARRQRAEAELAGAQGQILSFTRNVREKNAIIERLQTEMEAMRPGAEEEALDYRQQTLVRLQQSTILTAEEWETFRAAFEKVYPGFFIRLKERLPGLSAADVRFMALSKLKLEGKEMAAVLGISPASIRMSRHRLRKKFGMGEEESFEELADRV